MHRRSFAGPGPRLLELGSQPEKSGFVAEAPRELNADRKAVVAPVKREGERRLPGRVENRCERHVRKDLLGPFHGRHVPAILIELTQRGGKTWDGWGHEHVHVLEKCADLPRNSVPECHGIV